MRMTTLCTLLVPALLLIAANGCDPCPAYRCAGPPPLILTVRDAVNGEVIPGASVEANGKAAVLDQWWCDASRGEGCTHALRDLPVSDSQRVTNAGPGRGGYQPETALRIDLAVSATGYTAAAFTVSIATTTCGSPVAQSRVVDLSKDAAQPAQVTTAPAPPTCGQ